MCKSSHVVLHAIFKKQLERSGNVVQFHSNVYLLPYVWHAGVKVRAVLGSEHGFGVCVCVCACVCVCVCVCACVCVCVCVWVCVCVCVWLCVLVSNSCVKLRHASMCIIQQHSIHSLAGSGAFGVNAMYKDMEGCSSKQTFSFSIHSSSKYICFMFPLPTAYCFFCLARCGFRLLPSFRWDALWGIYSYVTLHYLGCLQQPIAHQALGVFWILFSTNCSPGHGVFWMFFFTNCSPGPWNLLNSFFH